jgi:hypothetical protein
MFNPRNWESLDVVDPGHKPWHEDPTEEFKGWFVGPSLNPDLPGYLYSKFWLIRSVPSIEEFVYRPVPQWAGYDSGILN